MDTRTCARCLIGKPASDYPEWRGKIHGARCLACLAELRRIERAARPPKPKRLTDRDRTEKRCNACGAVKSVADFYWSQRKWSAECKPCRRSKQRARRAADPEAARMRERETEHRLKPKRLAKNRAYAAANRERLREYGKAHYSAQRDRLIAQMRAYYWANRERLNSAARQRRIANRDKINAALRLYHATNRERLNEYHRSYYAQHAERGKRLAREWRQRNPLLVAEYGMRYRVRKVLASVGKVNRAAVIARDRGICYLCGVLPTGWNLTLDHVIPLIAGGEHSEANLRVACRSCNSRKNRLPLTKVLHRFAIPAVQAALL